MYLVKMQNVHIASFVSLPLARQYVKLLGALGNQNIVVVKEWEREVV